MAFLLAIGKSDKTIAKRLGLTNVKAYREHPAVQALIPEMEANLFQKTEKDFWRLFPRSIRAARKLLDDGDRTMIELVWRALGRFPTGKEGEIPQNPGATFNGPVLITDKEDVNAAMALLATERRRQQKLKTISVENAPIEIGGQQEER